MGGISTLRHASGQQVIVANVLRYLNKNLKSSTKAFAITYLYIVLPKLLLRTLKMVLKKKADQKREWLKILHLLRNATKHDKFPVFMFKLVFILNGIDPVLNLALLSVIKDPRRARMLSIFLSSFTAASLTFPKFQQVVIAKHRFYSLDLSLFIIVRAADTMMSSMISGHSRYTSALDVASFMVCSFMIMRSWFYYPERLPPAYRDWITRAANMDYELITALRYLHHGKLFYGRSSENDEVLVPLCDRVGLDRKLGNPAITYPIPCDIVHSNMTKSCEVNALIRFWRGFRFSSAIYLPLNLILLLASRVSGRSAHRSMRKSLLRAVVSAVRSSTFLGTFIALNWYPICMARNKIGPFLSQRLPDLVDANYDKTLAPTLGCAVSGLSSVIETAKRRRDLTLFCAPKALLTVIPLEATVRNLKIESRAFSLFFAILVCYAKLSPSRVRGVYGGGLRYLLSE